MIYFISSFPFLLEFEVGGLGFEFCVLVAAGWRHALRSEWPLIICIIIIKNILRYRYKKHIRIYRYKAGFKTKPKNENKPQEACAYYMELVPVFCVL